ncbi:Hydroxyacylglutathione hydrolase, mitochondrial [Porphyridium purpureum]|uniref:hydroxyacylglutathione hydrolase n=1 Tax=Porphyridium purpureum TaxID=35688 RepID=A0A5J4YMV0_PORPP|nr:Hydroxyacylglutathione hydrolase, mitochondrial [Porphyridium purpureum]|eukprot:POR7251..scf295_9
MAPGAFIPGAIRSFTCHRQILPCAAACTVRHKRILRRGADVRRCSLRMHGSSRETPLALGTRAGQEVLLGDRLAVLPVPILSDNYSYLVIDRARKTAAAVDPAEPQVVVREANARGYRITSVITTHHHWDHAGGNAEIRQLLGKQDLEIIGGVGEDIPFANVYMKDGDEHKLKDSSLSIRAILTPCHTRGHVSFTVANPSSSGPGAALFCGDTLFIGGCGRFFEGSAKDMVASLAKLRKLPADTLVFCGHEYTISNLKFAAHVEAENEKVHSMLEWAKEQVARGDFTVPSTMGGELQYNPFMRCQELAGRHGSQWQSEEEAMASLREMKNRF